MAETEKPTQQKPTALQVIVNDTPIDLGVFEPKQGSTYTQGPYFLIRNGRTPTYNSSFYTAISLTDQKTTYVLGFPELGDFLKVDLLDPKKVNLNQAENLFYIERDHGIVPQFKDLSQPTRRVDLSGGENNTHSPSSPSWPPGTLKTLRGFPFDSGDSYSRRLFF